MGLQVAFGSKRKRLDIAFAGETGSLRHQDLAGRSRLAEADQPDVRGAEGHRHAARALPDGAGGDRADYVELVLRGALDAPHARQHLAGGVGGADGRADAFEAGLDHRTLLGSRHGHLCLRGGKDLDRRDHAAVHDHLGDLGRDPGSRTRFPAELEQQHGQIRRPGRGRGELRRVRHGACFHPVPYRRARRATEPAHRTEIAPAERTGAMGPSARFPLPRA
jgi:hypothetical protein